MNNCFKKTICLIFIFLIIVTVSGCSSSDNQDMNKILQELNTMVNAEEDKNIEIIKNMVTNDGYKLGELIDNSVGSATYEFYNPAEDGNVYITIKGNITYMDKPIVVTLQYKKIADDNYEFHALEYNDIPQNEFEKVAFFKFLKENAIEKGLKKDKNDTINYNVNKSSNNEYSPLHEDQISSNGEYILPTADSEYIPVEYMESMVTNGDTRLIRLAVNEMFARYGYTFQKKENIDYFSRKSWYEPIYGLSDDYIKENLFNEYERENMKNLLYVENLYK